MPAMPVSTPCWMPSAAWSSRTEPEIDAARYAPASTVRSVVPDDIVIVEVAPVRGSTSESTVSSRPASRVVNTSPARVAVERSTVTV